MRGTGPHFRRVRLDRAGVCLVCAAFCGLVSSCGGGTRQDASEPTGNYPVQITTAQFPTHQQLAQRTFLRLAVRNIGQQRIPDLAITISTNKNAILPFATHNRQPGLATRDRPVWVLENNYPKIGSHTAPAGAETADQKTFSFGALPAGRSRVAVWKVTPVHPGTFRLRYRVDAGLQGKAKAVTADGSPPLGSFVVQISAQPPSTGVNGAGQVVPIPGGVGKGK